jgi:aldehyde oxidoreductase
MNAPPAIALTVNGTRFDVAAPPGARLADVLRDRLGLTGTKIGCNAGDCGACTVLLDGAQVCACMVPVAQAAGRAITTVEGLATDGRLSRLQAAFLRHGAAQCGICTPGMLMAAHDLLERTPSPTQPEVEDALGGVLCRCTGYVKIVEAVMDAGRPAALPAVPVEGSAVGARTVKADGRPRVTGEARFGADELPADALALRIVRSPHARARFTLGDLRPLHDRWPGLVRVLTASDIPVNRYGIYPVDKDQPALAEGIVRYRGEAVVALVGEPDCIARLPDADVPISWEPLDPVTFAAARRGEAPALHDSRPDNVLTRGRLARGDLEAGFAAGTVEAEIAVETSFVEHAYIEPEAGYARRVGDRIEIVACTQSPYMDRDEVAHVMGMAPDRIRIIPTATGGGFGGKLDLSIQPVVAVAAWLTGRPVRCVYSRPESMKATTKRHPAAITARAAADAEGNITAFDFNGDFNTGAYASWGPTVAGRVPVHATGPYRVGAARVLTRALYTNDPPAGAFRGFGVPQAAIAGEALVDMLADQLGIDPLEFRYRNALRVGDATPSGQVLKASAGLAECLAALRPHWQAAQRAVTEANAKGGRRRRGAGIACLWYGIGNTALSNPSAMRLGLKPDGRLMLYNGAVDIGQGSTTIMPQIAADALGVPVDRIDFIVGDTDLTEDAGKTSASRQTYVSGKAVELAGRDLRGQILRRVNAGDTADIALHQGYLIVRDGGAEHRLDLGALKPDERGDVLSGFGRFDPPTTPLDRDGQGEPYASYAFGAQMVELSVDTQLGKVQLLRIVAAHDVGRAVNPQQVEGQLHGGIAQGLGLALMEEYLPGRTENLHDYLIPTVGDMPPIECILVESPDPLGPFGAKGVGEPALVGIPPAIFAAIHQATGVRLTRAPATPDRIHAALVAAGVTP